VAERPIRLVTARVSEIVLRTRVIVRLDYQNRMVTMGYQKGVYEGYQENPG